MDIRKFFTQQLNFRYTNHPVDLALFDALRPAADGKVQRPSDARVLFEGKGVQVLRLTVSVLRGDIEQACIRLLRKYYPDAVYLFADRPADNHQTSYHLCNDAGKQLVLTPEKQRLFTEKVAFFEVTDDVTGTLDLKERIARAYETEKLTRKFYGEFQAYRDLLLKFIQGIPAEEDRLWYVSVLLNRLMFIYFIQKHGLIGGDRDYLRNRLAEHEQRGANFYAAFLEPLFFQGFAARKGQRGAHEVLFAGVPYLNGGLFVKHALEEQYPDIAVENGALRKLLDYFNQYNWYLDDRPLRDEDEINTDVLGYIFEKYVNQKQMGAYYTQEDITGYNCKYTIVPFLFDKLARLQGRWTPEASPLPIHSENITRYVYEAVQTAAYLPTETEREYAARRRRLEQIQQDASTGRIAAVNDLITYNLDIVTYADDVIAQMDEQSLWQFYFECLKKITVLDPTSGSGAFLFAALNILLPLYQACLQRMRRFVDADARKRGQHTAHFREELARIAQHDNERYYVVKSIVVNNLYGVDIMEEATEICKLRLFLRLAAEITDPERIEPLPDIDFNIQAGNSLIGYASIAELEAKHANPLGLEMPIVSDIKRLNAQLGEFRRRQLEIVAPEAWNSAKDDIKQQLEQIEALLNQDLAGSKQIKRLKNGKWNTQPLHWYVAFNDILTAGGFDVIVGNPPYVVYSKAKVDYDISPQGYKTLSSKNLYAFVFERAMALAKSGSPICLIVQLTVLSSEYLPSLQDLLAQRGCLYALPFPRRPESVFDGVEMPVAILLTVGGTPNEFITSRVMRFYTEERSFALSGINFVKHSVRVDGHRIAKIGSLYEKSILAKILANPIYLDSLTEDESKWIMYYQEACRYWVKAYPGVPFFKRNGEAIAPPHGRNVAFKSQAACAFVACLLNSSLFYWYYSALSDCEHINDGLIRHLPIPKGWESTDWIQLSSRLVKSMAQHARRKVISTAQGHTIEYDEIKALHSKPIIDEIDRVLAQHYGFTDEELDFIINYDIKYRMGQDASGEAGE